MKQVVCPYCFDKFKRSEVLFRCSNSRCKEEDDNKMKEFWGEQFKGNPVITPKNFSGKLLDIMPKSAKCDKCSSETTKTICPHCHNELPHEMVESGGLIISIIGARSSGKTNYITTLINELKHKGHLINLGIYDTVVGRKPEEYTTARYKTDFYEKLYKNKECHSQTAVNDTRSKIPLIYKLFSTNKKDQAYLVLYDTAGENFADPKAIAEKAKFLKNSDGIILLLDTFCIPNVHERLQSKFKLDPIELNYDLIINNVIQHFDEPENKKQIYSKPLALTFSKIDAIVNNEELFGDARLPNISMNANSRFLDGDGYSLDDVDSINQGIQDGLYNWEEGQFIKSINSPPHFNEKATCFGISALGDMPVGGTIKNLKPYRVMDPLIWILYKLNFPLLIKK
jgi:Ni2+-binding GTPase involved in maturation of urease and hydrogenase